MCPKFSWVTSFTNHLLIEANTAIELRQFAFNGGTNGNGDFFYHCEVSRKMRFFIEKDVSYLRWIKNFLKNLSFLPSKCPIFLLKNILLMDFNAKIC